MTPFLADPSDFCPGCHARRCECPPTWHEDALDDDAYQAGRAACLSAGYDERPEPVPLRLADPHAEAWYEAYDDAGCGLASRVEDPAAHAAGVRALVAGHPLPELSDPEPSGFLHGPWRVSDTPF